MIRWSLALLAAAGAALAGGGPAVAQMPSPRAGDASVLTEPVQYAYVSGARLGYRVAGAGSPLVLITGSGSTMAEWDPRLLDALAERHTVIVFDNRGAGTSTGGVGKLTVAQMARDTAQLIAQVTAGTADVLGWSMGGYIAQTLALNAPSRVRRLVLASTDCGGPSTIPPKPWALRILTDPAATQKQRLRLLFPPDQAGAAGAWGAAIGAAYAAAGYQPAEAFTVPPSTMAAQTRAAGSLWLRRGGGTCSRLGDLRQRVLVAAGREDVVVPVENHRALADRIPRAQTRLYADAGHGFLFQPELGFASVVDRFLHAP